MLHSDWQREMEALNPASSNTGVLWLPQLTLARFAGPDVLNFLKGYLTIDPMDLARATNGSSTTQIQTRPFAICNIKGRVVVNGWCYAVDSETVDLVLHQSLMEHLASFMKPYLAFSRTRLADLGEQVILLGSYDTAFAPPPEGGSGTLLRLDPRRALYVAPSVAAARAAWDDRPGMTMDAWEAGLIRDLLPLVTLTTSGQFLPQMLALDRIGAVSFSKGCYLGQEVVARAQHRGQVKRGLAQLTWDTGPNPEPGAELLAADGRPAGKVLQIAPAAHLCLAVVALDAAGPFQQRDQQGEPGIRRKD